VRYPPESVGSNSCGTRSRRSFLFAQNGLKNLVGRDVENATATEFLLKNQGKPGNFIWGELVSGRQLSFLVKNLQMEIPN
jgi:hypothetical protein